VIGWVGRLTFEKGPDVLLDAVRCVSDLPLVVSVVGSGAERSALQARARSLRLNFEMNVECYSVELGAHMDGLVQARIGTARALSLEAINARSVPVKLRDGVARLFAPFL